jgi:CS domain
MLMPVSAQAQLMQHRRLAVLAARLTEWAVACLQVAVDITAQHLRVSVCGSQVLGGQLLQQVNPYCSAWQVADGIVEVTLLKASRRGHYAPGTTNADTYWDRVWVKALPQDRLLSPQPPLQYYSSSVFDDDGALAGGSGAHAQIGSAAHTVKAAVGATQTPSLQLVAMQS